MRNDMESTNHNPEMATSTYRSSLMRVEDIVLLLDRSGSMSLDDYPPSRMSAAKEAALEFINSKIGVDSRDRVGVVSFGFNVSRQSKLKEVGRYRNDLERQISKIKAFGSTPIGNALKEAFKVLEMGQVYKYTIPNNNNHQKRIVLLSDGQNTSGPSPSGIATAIKRSGVIIDTIGIGTVGEGKSNGDKELDEAALKEIASPDRHRYIDESSSLIAYFSELAEKVDPSIYVQTELYLQAQNRNFNPLGVWKTWSFERSWVKKVTIGSPHLGSVCLNERDEATSINAGDTIVICPECGGIQHKDCWAWNGGKCFGGDTPCSGRQ